MASRQPEERTADSQFVHAGLMHGDRVIEYGSSGVGARKGQWFVALAPSTTVEISRCKRPVVGVGKENFLASLTEEPMVHNAYATRPTTFLGQSVPRFTHASSALLKKVSAKKLDFTLLLSKKDIGGPTRQAQI